MLSVPRCRLWLTPLVGLITCAPGCSHGAAGASFLNFFGLGPKPVVVALAVEPGVLNPFAAHEELRRSMSTALGRPVRLTLCLPSQLEPNLKLGLYDFAYVTPACYAAMKDAAQFEALAVSVDQSGRVARGAVLVVAADSELQRVEDLRGKVVAFGPRGDARTHHAALALLRAHGLKKTDLSLSLFPVPGSLKHYAKMRDVARSVINGSADAGFIDEVTFEELPASAAQGEPARDKLRVIARTISVPDKLVIRSPKVDPQTARKMAEFLLTADARCPQALRPLLLSAYREPSAQLLAARQQWIKP